MPRIRTGFSFRNSVGTLEDVMKRIIECGYTHAPITDCASTFGWSKWSKLAKKNNLKPVFGVELGVTESINSKKPIVDYWTFIAKDSLLPIHQLFETATEQFRYTPLITYAQAMAAQNVFKIVGHRAHLNLIEPQPDLFIGLGPACAKGYISEALKLGHKFCAVSDNRYPNDTKEDQILYETICGRGASTQSYDQFIQTKDEWFRSVEGKYPGDTFLDAEAWGNRDIIFNGSTAQLGKGELPKYEVTVTLKDQCIAGAQKLKVDLNDPIYSARLERELALIYDKKFEDYFYIVGDFVREMRKIMRVGPARGSSCGSLVCYLLEITKVDPIPYGLIFERFLSKDRNDMPDVDIDFSDQYRYLAFEYLSKKYGAEHFARLGSVNLYKVDSALNEASAAMGLPKWKVSSMADGIIKRSSGDARALDSLEDAFKNMPAGQALIAEHPELMVACRMEGHPHHSSQHASGAILTKNPVNTYVAIDRRTNATQCDKKDAEDLNLLKIDVLGLKQLGIFEYAIDLAGLDKDILDHIPMDDAEAFKVLNDAKFCGIFQFAGHALQKITKQIETKELNDLCVITALGRPGPLESGGANEWVRRKNEKVFSYPHKIFEPYLKDTLGIIIYQEQVMEICHNIGNLEWDDVSEIRKSMSKSMGKEHFNQWNDKFKSGAIKNGCDIETADNVWQSLCTYGSYGFNKSHAVAYGIISYQCCWLKAHYPFEFAAATLTYESDADKQLKILREMVDEGYNYIPVDVKISTDRWTVGFKEGARVLVGPLSNIKGIGPKTITSILSSRARGEAMPNKAAKLLANPVTSLDDLFPIKNAFKRVLPDPAARNIHTAPTPIKDLPSLNNNDSAVCFCVISKIIPRDENEEILIAKRKGKRDTSDKTAFLNLRITDDSDTILARVSKHDYKELGKAIVDRGSPGKHLYAVQGQMFKKGDFSMMILKNVRHIGPIAQEKPKVMITISKHYENKTEIIP